MRQYVIGVDVGGTKVAAGLVDLKGRLKKSVVVPTLAGKGFKASFGQIEKVIANLIRHAGGKDAVLGIGVCTPGPLNPRTGVVVSPANLPGWRNIQLTRLLEKIFKVPARLENDANAAGLAEVLFGAATQYRDVFYVTVSTGIGTGIIVNRKIYHGKNGVAGEGGHVSIDFQSPYRCSCGTIGCIEALASGPAMVRRARVKLEQEFMEPSAIPELTKGRAELVSPKKILEAAKRGNRIAKEVLDETGFYLGVWLAGMISLFDPEAIVIGGGVSNIGKPLFDKIRSVIPERTINREFARNTPILPAKLKSNVGVFGAASLFLPGRQ